MLDKNFAGAGAPAPRSLSHLCRQQMWKKKTDRAEWFPPDPLPFGNRLALGTHSCGALSSSRRIHLRRRRRGGSRKECTEIIAVEVRSVGSALADASSHRAPFPKRVRQGGPYRIPELPHDFGRNDLGRTGRGDEKIAATITSAFGLVVAIRGNAWRDR